MNDTQLDRPAVGTMLQRLLGLLLFASLVSGCVSQTVKRVDTTPARQATAVIPEAMLLDVGIHLFDPNVPEEWRDRERDGILPEVRRAEARYMPFILKDTLEGTGNWGAVRVIPRDTMAVDVTVDAKLLESNGETLRLEVEVADASGRRWFQREYGYQASRYAYDDIDVMGHVVPKGSEISLLLAAANHDPKAFEAPERFNPARPAKANLSFGAGLHFCVGAPLARLELQVALPILFQRLPRLHMTEPLRYSDSYHFHGLERLLVAG